MIEIKEVTNKKLIKDFINFPLKLYKGNPYFVPPLYSDEKKIFKETSIYNKTCEQIFFNCYKDGKMAGRIQAIIQKQYNEIHNEKRVRFTRFDSIDDVSVSNALFDSAVKWSKEKGMKYITGPLGYSDLEREGLLIEGFDELSTFEEQYNFEYYKKLVEAYGFTKEVDWVESRLTFNENYYEKLTKLTDVVFKRYNLHFETKKKNESKKDYINRLAPEFFRLLDEGYKDIYGTVPFTEEMKDDIIKQFVTLINPKYLAIVADEEGKGVAFGICFPGIGKALQKSGGRLTPLTLLKLFKALKKPESVDLGLTAVDPEYLNKGINAPIMLNIMDLFVKEKVKYLETNLNLEENVKVRAFWKYFNERQHKRRRSYIKEI